MITDFDNRAERTQEDLAHFHEWVGSVNYEAAAAEQTRIAKDLIAKDYAIHFHTFSRSTFAGLLKEASRRFGGELLEYRVSVHPELVEFIAILRKGTQTRVNASISQNSATENIGRVFKRMRRRIKRVRLPHK
jgi:hypothetical protein